MEVYPAITQQAHASDVEQSIDKVFFWKKEKFPWSGLGYWQCFKPNYFLKGGKNVVKMKLKNKC